MQKNESVLALFYSISMMKPVLNWAILRSNTSRDNSILQIEL